MPPHLTAIDIFKVGVTWLEEGTLLFLKSIMCIVDMHYIFIIIADYSRLSVKQVLTSFVGMSVFIGHTS